MLRLRYLAILFLLAITLAPQASATSVNYWLSVDDYGSVYIDGNLVASYDSSPWAYVFFTADLTPGWHDFQLIYKNRWGTDALYFSQQYPGQPNYSYVPRDYFRSFDQNATLVSGLRADYYNLGGTTIVATVYGEGPIANGWSHMYQNVYYPNDTYYWAGLYSDWSQFEEHLSGQIFVPTPEPSSLLLVGTGILSALAVVRRKLLS